MGEPALASIDRLHPQMRELIEAARAQPPLETMSVEEARARPVGLVAAPQPVGSVLQRGIPGPAGLIRVRLYRPKVPAPHPVLVYFHGGGWVTGSLDGSDAVCRWLVHRASCAVVSVDYRLAPEHKFPSAVEDAFASIEWVWTSGPALGLDKTRIAVGGTSAGANLAAVAAMLARDRGAPRIVFQLLLIPVVEARYQSASFAEFAEGFGLTPAACIWFGRHYMRGPEDADDPRISILRAPDLRGLPPAFIGTAECDPLRDEGEAFADRLRESGVRVTTMRYMGMAHPFLGSLDRIDAARQAIADAGAALHEAFSASSATAREV